MSYDEWFGPHARIPNNKNTNNKNIFFGKDEIYIYTYIQLASFLRDANKNSNSSEITGPLVPNMLWNI